MQITNVAITRVNFFSNKYNLIYASAAARSLIDSYMPAQTEQKAVKEEIQVNVSEEKTVSEVYRVKTVVTSADEMTDTTALSGLLNEQEAVGYKLLSNYNRTTSDGRTETVFIFKK